MSRMTDLPASVTMTSRHCDVPGCAKCRARFRWLRRRAWRSRKFPNRSSRARKG